MNSPSMTAASPHARRNPATMSWECQPRAWQLLLREVDRLCAANPYAGRLRERLRDETGTRLVDWLDYICLAPAEPLRDELRSAGFEPSADGTTYHHPGGLFPRWVLSDSTTGIPRPGLGLKVESVDAFLAAHPEAPAALTDVDEQGTPRAHGSPDASLRWSLVADAPHAALVIVERHGVDGFTGTEPDDAQRAAIANAWSLFDERPRPLPLDDRPAGFAEARRRFETVSQQLGRDRACDLFFASERRYWQQRNHAARVQRARQDRLGLGWANHDHHTYRSSREHFAALITTLELMGFECRERFYAGAQAGWGAQVLEQPVCGLVVFADVDMSPDEVTGDFPHQGLPPRDSFGTVGLWCQLHGEAFLSAGMHHLECQFDFEAARAQLASAGVPSMAPFTDFPFLRQAFTEGEMWQVPEEHLRELVRRGVLTETQAAEFQAHGARGSHLEILQRDEGYKGFNQTGISDIIHRTDPRK